MIKIIKPKEREAVLRSLRSGVVPRIGLQHLHVGREKELKSFVNDINVIADGGTSFRLVIGEYGSGKTFFLSLVRAIALEKGLVTINADLSPTKRLYGSDVQVRTLLTELITSMSTRTKQEGNALANILEKLISNARDMADSRGTSVNQCIQETLMELNEYPGGHDFITVITKYWKGYENGDTTLMDRALSWLKAEYSTKTDSYRDLGVRSYLNYTTFYNTLKLYSILVQKAGYKGLLVSLDEMVNLYKVPNNVNRKSNYEVILNILNDTLQGVASNIGFIMSGTPDFLIDRYRGLYSYEALESRLAENSFSSVAGVTDYNSTVLRLPNLTQEEVYMLLKNVRNIFAKGNPDEFLVPDEAIVAFMKHCASRIGESYFRTPRTTIKGFVDFLSILEQYPDKNWSDLIEGIEVEEDVEPSGLGTLMNGGSPSHDDSDGFASFKL
jgi:hypothetical protein